MPQQTKVQHLDRHIGKHPDAGDSVLVATVKAVKEIRQEKGGKR